jgi:hypothetical protein
VVVGVLVGVGGWWGGFPGSGRRSQGRGVIGVLRALSAEVAGLAAAEAFVEHLRNPRARVNNGWGGTSSPTFGLRPGRVLGGPGTLGSVGISDSERQGIDQRIEPEYSVWGTFNETLGCLCRRLESLFAMLGTGQEQTSCTTASVSL